MGLIGLSFSQLNFFIGINTFQRFRRPITPMSHHHSAKGAAKRTSGHHFTTSPTLFLVHLPEYFLSFRGR